MLTFFRKTMQNDKGAVMPIIGLSIITLMVFIGVAIDMGRYFLVRNKLLTALDSALLGAANISTINLAQNDPQQIIDRGKEFFLANYPVDYLGTNITEQNIAIRVSPETGTVYGDVVDVSLPLVFAGIFQLSSPKAAASAPNININVFSEVQRVLGTNLEIALVLDYTPSMCFQLNTGSMFGTPRVADATCGKFNKKIGRAHV